MAATAKTYAATINGRSVYFSVSASGALQFQADGELEETCRCCGPRQQHSELVGNVLRCTGGCGAEYPVQEL